MAKDIVTIKDAFRNIVEEYPHKTAVIFNDEKYTFLQLDQLVEKIAAYFHNKGMKKQEKAIIYMSHMPQWVAIWLAMQRLGVAVIPVTHFYGHEELSYIAKDSETRTIFCMDRNFNQVLQATVHTPFKNIIVVGDNYSLDSAHAVLAKGAEVLSYASIMHGETLPLPEVQVEANDLAEILYTGGTTGVPKGVPLKNSLLLTAMNVKRAEFEPALPKGKGVALQGAPLFHILGKEMGFSALLSGDTLVLLAKMDLDEILAHIEKHKVTTFFCTPTLCRMILEHENINKYDFSSLVYVFTAGEAMPKEVGRRWTEVFGNPSYNGYGSTETCGGIAGIPLGIPFPEGTSGRIVPTKEVMLLKQDTQEPAAPGEPGELLVHSEDMVTRYLNKPEETAKHFVEIDGKIWYKTGDIVRFDEDGWLFFVDRSVDLIKHKGYRVAATKVEAVIYKHEAVSECCVVGVPDEKFGEKIKAFIITKVGYDGVTAEEIINWCKDKLSSYEVPNHVKFSEVLPKSAVGKILRRKLRDQERENYKQQK